MEYEELKSSIDGLHAYDTGCVDSGIKDERLRAKVIEYLRSLGSDEHREIIAKLVIDLCLSSEALSQGYGPEDAKEFLDWLEDHFVLRPA